MEMAVGLSVKALSRLPHLTTPAFNGPEERIGEETREFDIGGNLIG
jgi:hypothetical protein